jgi:hypothetical protein
MNKKILTTWYHITYFRLFNWLPLWFYEWWKKHKCSKSYHLFDETSNGVEHSLFCDACGLTVVFEREYQDEVFGSGG